MGDDWGLGECDQDKDTVQAFLHSGLEGAKLKGIGSRKQKTSRPFDVMNNRKIRKITDWIEPDARNMDLAPTSSVLNTTKQRLKKMLALEWEVAIGGN